MPDLPLHGRPQGKFSRSWFSETQEVECTGRRRLIFGNVPWPGSEFILEDGAGNKVGRALRSGILTRNRDLELSTGPALLAAAGFFATGYEVQQKGETMGGGNHGRRDPGRAL